MAVGIFRKISDKLQTLWDSLKQYAPLITNIGKAVAPAVSAFNPAIGAGISFASDTLNKLVAPDFAQTTSSGKIIPSDIESDVSPFIKFKRRI